jgi:hypothetical protein
MAAMAAHAGGMTVPGQTRLGTKSLQHQHHRGKAQGGTIASGAPASIRSPRIRAHVQTSWGRRGGDEGQITADHLVRHREADRLRPTASLELAGGGRNNSATTVAMRIARASGELGLDGDDVYGGDWVGWIEPNGLVQPNQLGHLTGGAQGGILVIQK